MQISGFLIPQRFLPISCPRRIPALLKRILKHFRENFSFFPDFSILVPISRHSIDRRLPKLAASCQQKETAADGAAICWRLFAFVSKAIQFHFHFSSQRFFIIFKADLLKLSDIREICSHFWQFFPIFRQYLIILKAFS